MKFKGRHDFSFSGREKTPDVFGLEMNNNNDNSDGNLQQQQQKQINNPVSTSTANFIQNTWEIYTQGFPTMDFQKFSYSWYNIADVWISTGSVDDYLGFAERVLTGIVSGGENNSRPGTSGNGSRPGTSSSRPGSKTSKRPSSSVGTLTKSLSKNIINKDNDTTWNQDQSLKHNHIVGENGSNDDAISFSPSRPSHAPLSPPRGKNRDTSNTNDVSSIHTKPPNPDDELGLDELYECFKVRRKARKKAMLLVTSNLLNLPSRRASWSWLRNGRRRGEGALVLLAKNNAVFLLLSRCYTQAKVIKSLS